MSVFSLSVQSGEYCLTSCVFSYRNEKCFLWYQLFHSIFIMLIQYHLNIFFTINLFYFLSFFIISPYKVSSLCVQDIYCWYIPVPTANFYPAPDIKERTYREMDCAFLDAHHVHNHHHKTQNWFETRIYSLVFCTFII